MQNFIALTGLINSIICLILGFLVLAKDPRRAVHRLYFFLSISIGAWSLGYFFWLKQTSDPAIALFWARALTIGSIFLPIFFLHWLAAYFDQLKKNRYVIIYAYLQGLFFLGFSYSPLLVKTVEPFRDIFTFWPKPGPLYHFFLINFLALLAFAYYLLVSQYRKSQGMQKLKIKYLLICSLIAYISGSSNFPLWYGIPVIPVFNGFFVLFPGIIAYSIVRHHFMDIKIVLKKSTVLLSSIGTILLLLLGLRYLGFKIFSSSGFWFDSVLVLISAMVYPAIKDFYLKIANKYFFSSLYNSQELVAGLGEKISSTLDAKEIYKLIDKSFFLAFYPKNFAVLLVKNGEKVFSLKYSANLNGAGRAEIEKTANKLGGIIDQQKIIFVDDLILANDKKTKEPARALNRLRVSLLLPFYFEEKIMGLIALGEKESREIYNDEDLAVFNIISAQIAIAVKNAMLHNDSLLYAENLNTEKNKISSILANFIDPVLFIDKEKRLRIFNPAARQIFGLQDKDLGKPIEAIIYKTPELRAIILADSRKGSLPGQKEISLEQNGNQKYYKALSTEVLNDKKEALGTLKLFYDLTKEKELDKTKSEFVAVAAHQLRTPLTATKWALDLVLKGEAGKIEPEQQSYLETGFASNERMINIVNDLLCASRIEEGKFHRDLSECDIIKIVEELIKEGRINARCDFAKNLPLILADKKELSTAIENILTNAVDYSPDKTPIRVKAARSGEYLTLTISDDGIGVPDKDKKKLFSKFFRAGNAIKTRPDGSGLGLFIAKNIVEAHGGDLIFESQENKGTTVTLKLPLAPPKSE